MRFIVQKKNGALLPMLNVRFMEQLFEIKIWFEHQRRVYKISNKIARPTQLH